MGVESKKSKRLLIDGVAYTLGLLTGWEGGYKEFNGAHAS